MISQAIRNRPWTALFTTGLMASSIYKHRKESQRQLEDAKKKKVLVLPFYRMKIVEQKSPASLSTLARNSGGNPVGGDKVIEMPADELVSLIHEAASDPSIVSLYGIFGNGGSFSTGGWAHLEEVRNAIRVFATSHRVHMEPGMETPAPRDKKALYVYSNTFVNPMGSTKSMKDYFVASAFSHIHLQPQGDLNLFGLHVTNTFFREALQKYGINVNVWKHGAYKNMANQFTHSQFTKEHYDNVAGVLLPIHQHVCDAIYTSRHHQLQKYSDFAKFWNMVENAGSLPARVAQQIGFVDHLPRLDPLDALVKNNQEETVKSATSTLSKTFKDPALSNEASDEEAGTSDANKSGSATEDFLSSLKSDRSTSSRSSRKDAELEEEQWKSETDTEHFHADAKISIEAYARKKAVDREKEAKQWKTYQSLKKLSDSSPVAGLALSLMGYSAPYFNVPKDKFTEKQAEGTDEKIAVVKISGPIGEGAARKAEKALRKIKEQKDIKCVVLRVDSPGGSINACETIYQELQDLPQKVVVSFGNVSASGGYYISANAERIFASPTTITGSIGVVMLRMDFRALAKQYGVTFDSIPTSSLSGSFDPFFPMNQQMNENFANAADRAYYRFKSLVSDGRGIDMKTVETIAQGRVFTGEQASQIGLVDELGGLHRAIAYAQRNFTSSGHAQVIQWPPKKSLLDFLMGDEQDDFEDLELPSALFDIAASYLSEGDVRLSWIRNRLCLDAPPTVNANNDITNLEHDLPFPLVTSGIMLAADENTAIQQLLEANNIPQAKILSNLSHGLWE